MENNIPNNNTDQQTDNIQIQIPNARNIARRRSLIPVSFAFVIVFFFFSFCDFRCGAQKIGSLTGVQLVIGTQLMNHDMMSGRETEGEKVPSSIWAILPIIAAIIGLGAFLIHNKSEAYIGTIAGGIGCVSLLVLQFALKSAIEEKGEGQIEISFLFGYWGALLAITIAGLISYLRIRWLQPARANVVAPAETNISPPAGNNILLKLEQLAGTARKKGIDVLSWLKKNKMKTIITASSILILYLVYFFFIKNDPEKDGQKAATANCDCSQQLNDATIKADEKFSATFSPDSFTNRQEARNKLQELQNSVVAANSECNTKAQTTYTELRNRYINNQGEIQKFDFGFNALNGTCSPTNQNRLDSIRSEVEHKISTIKSVEPDIKKIQSDLLGQEIPGWKFSYLNEYTTANIMNSTKGAGRIEYQVQFHLKDMVQNNEHDCEVLVVYTEGEEGWFFTNVQLIYITYTMTINVNEWTTVAPLQNCSYSIIDNGQKFWVQDGIYGDKYKGGPDGDQYSLHSSQIYLISREDHPITLSLKYFPNN